MAEDLERFKVSPPSGSEMGNQAIVDSNLEVTKRFCLPSSGTNTLNGGKSKDGVAKLTNGVLNILFNGLWTEYLTSVDGLKEVGGITLEDSVVTILSPVRWRINSVNYSKLTNTVFNIVPTTIGYKRIDLIYANTSNAILLIQGVETTGVAVEPSLPPNTVKVAPVFVSDDAVQQPFPDLSGFLTKEIADTLYSIISPSGAYIQASPVESQDDSIKIKKGLNAADDRFVVQVSGYVSVANAAKTGLIFDISDGNGVGIYNSRLKLQSDEVKFITLRAVGGGMSVENNDGEELFAINENGEVTISDLSGTGTRPVAAAADGTLVIGTAPNLQSVTNGTGNNTTENALQVTGQTNFDIENDGITIIRDEASTLAAIINHTASTQGAYITFNPDSTTGLRLAGTNVSFGLTINNTTSSTDLLAVFDGRVQVQNAYASGDAVNKGQLDAAVAAGVGVTVNSATGTLSLTARGYYNYTGASNTVWSLPASPTVGLFYRLYNQSSATGTVTVNAAGSDTFYQGGIISSSIILNVGENLTMQWSGLYWNIYSA